MIEYDLSIPVDEKDSDRKHVYLAPEEIETISGVTPGRPNGHDAEFRVNTRDGESYYPVFIRVRT